jgi:hypothetical protein
MAKTSPTLAKALLLTFDLLKALEMKNMDLVYELKEKIKIYLGSNNNHADITEKEQQIMKMKEIILNHLIQREPTWIESLFEEQDFIRPRAYRPYS